MLKRLVIIIFFSFFISISFSEFLQAQHKPLTVHNKYKGLRILMIGDSNTEIGNITIPLKEILDSTYGNFGTGYCTLNTNSSGRIPNNLQISCDSNWTRFDMRNDFKPEIPPYYAPDGLSISSTVPGAKINAEFSGSGIDLYLRKQPVLGKFSVSIDGKSKKYFSTRGKTNYTKKIYFENLNQGDHKMTVELVSGSVTLFGIDIKNENIKDNKRFVVHKWANAWASTKEFINIDKSIFNSALKELNPNYIIILLGTNDHNLDYRTPVEVKNNLVGIILRIKKALPKVKILLLSTFTTDGEPAKTLLPVYVSDAFPAAAKETGVYYWDLNTWFGPFDKEKINDGGVHVSEIYGRLISRELLNQLNRIQHE